MLENLGQDMGIRMSSISKIEQEIKERYALNYQTKMTTALAARLQHQTSSEPQTDDHHDTQRDEKEELGNQLLLKERR